MPITTYREWENGRKIIGEPYLELCRVFDVSLFELMTGTKSAAGDALQLIDVIEHNLQQLKETLRSR